MESMRNSNKLILLSMLILSFAIGLASCTPENTPFPRPKGWPRVVLPEHSYQQFENTTCPFTFEFPKIAEIEKQKADSCWMDFFFPDFNCRWHVTYRYVPGSGKTLAEHHEEYRKLVFKHIQKVSQIKENQIESPYGSGVFYELFGTVGVPAQIVFSDSTHLVMASFYFDTAVRNDSLAPVIDFMKDDLQHMAQSLRWK